MKTFQEGYVLLGPYEDDEPLPELAGIRVIARDHEEVKGCL